MNDVFLLRVACCVLVLCSRPSLFFFGWPLFAAAAVAALRRVAGRRAALRFFSVSQGPGGAETKRPAEHWFSRSLRLRYDPVVEDDFALAIPDDVGQVGVAGDDLCRDAACKQSRPAQDDEAPVQRCAEEFFHEPEGMAPFVQAYVRQDHERAGYGHDERERGAPGVQRQAGHGVQVARNAADDVHGEGAIKYNDVAGGEAGVADDDLVPGGVLFGEEAAAPVDAKQVDAQPHHPVEVTLDFQLGVKVVQVGVAGLPDPAPGDEGKDRHDDHVDAP